MDGKALRLFVVLLCGIAYLVVGIAFPNPPASDPMQFAWRLAAWAICGFAFTTHIALEHFRFRNSPWRTALHVSVAVAFGALGLALAANIHARATGTGNLRLLALALLIWPIMSGIPALLVAWGLVAGLTRLSRPC